jgi:hypothetical protein
MLSNASGRAEVAQDVCRAAQFHLKRIGIEVTLPVGCLWKSSTAGYAINREERRRSKAPKARRPI